MTFNKPLEEVINFKGISLINDKFVTNRQYINTDETAVDIENNLQIKTSFGSNKEDDSIIALKVITTFIQRIKKDDEVENEARLISELNFEYMCLFDIEEGYAELFWKVLKERESNKNQKHNKALRYMIESIYPYIKEHIEGIYKKANMPITVPLKI